MKYKVWTVTSKNGQVLCAEEQPDTTVMLSSDKGNHGTVTNEVWTAKLTQMVNTGYTVKINQ